MKRNSLSKDSGRLARKLQHLKQKRRKRKGEIDRAIRGRLTEFDRELVLRKTGRRCHICGGKIRTKEGWQADHVLAHSVGGKHTIDNYLPAHKLCNHYRWDYSADEFQYILKIGVWTCTQIRRQSNIGIEVARSFMAHERARETRRKAH